MLVEMVHGGIFQHLGGGDNRNRSSSQPGLREKEREGEGEGGKVGRGFLPLSCYVMLC